MQIIHPSAFYNKNSFWGDLSKIPTDRLFYEDDLLPTGISMLSELLRRDSVYSINRKTNDKINVTCRGKAILLTSILKAKGIPSRVRSGFASYIKDDGNFYDHWITEYFNGHRWVLVDADMYGSDLGFDLTDIPRDRFLFGAEAYLKIRNNEINKENIIFASNPITVGMESAIRGLIYDYFSLMNNEISFLHFPRYFIERDFVLSIKEYMRLDNLATLLLNPNKNFYKIKNIWDKNPNLRKLYGGLND